MDILNKQPQDITKDDIQALFDTQVRENVQIEYKSELPANSDEFRKDVVGMANAAGGVIIFGIKEAKDEAFPESITGVDLDDTGKRRLYQILDTNIDPPLPLPQIVIIPDCAVVVVRVFRSWQAPHRVSSHKSKFFIRGDAEVRPMDAAEIRHAMQFNLIDKIRQFRKDRLFQIKMKKDIGGATAVVHFFPLASFSQPTAIDILRIPDPYPSGYCASPSVNLDGKLFKGANFYTQIFRNGVFEVMIAPTTNHWILEGSIIASIKRHITILPVEISLSTYITVTILRAREMNNQSDNQSILRAIGYGADRDELELPEFIYDAANYHDFENRLLECLAQSFGMACSLTTARIKCNHHPADFVVTGDMLHYLRIR